MAENSWPFENADSTEAQYTKLFKEFQDTGVLAGLATTVTSGMDVQVAIGSAFVQGWFYENTTAKALTVGAAPATQIRKDYVVLTVDTVANTILASVKAGTVSASGTLPALTQTLALWEHPIATITVAAGAANLVAANVTAMLDGVGLRVRPYANDTERARLGTGSAFLLGINTTTQKVELRVAGSWVTLNPDVDWGSLDGKPTTFTPSTHTHDDRYFTEAEVTNLLGGKAASSHSHDDRYYTESEMNTKLGAKADNGHTHDDRYFTEAEANSRFAYASHSHDQSQIGNQQNMTVGNSSKVNGIKVTSGGGAPGSPATNDLWFP